MENSNGIKIHLVVALMVVACRGGFAADVVTMTDGIERLTGTVRSIEGGGALELDSGLSGGLLRVRTSMISKVDFSANMWEVDPAPTRVELINGDVIPCAVVGLGKDGLVAESAELGEIRIDRSHLAMVQFGVRRNRVIYSASEETDGWSIDEESPTAWRFDQGSLVSTGQSHARRRVAFPEQCILKFRLEWEKNTMPAFKVYFADPLVNVRERCDRYFLTFRATGFEIIREAANNRRFTTVAYVDRMPTLCEGQRLMVELHLDRRESSMRLVLDGKLVGDFADPVPSPPSGSGLVLVNETEEVEQRLRGLEVLECDDTLSRHRVKLRGREAGDGLITRSDVKWSGSVEGIKVTSKGEVLIFRTVMDEKRMEFPMADVSTVFFDQERSVNSSTQDSLNCFVLNYAGGGRIRFSSCRFSNDIAFIRHPLLGSLKLNRDIFRMIEMGDPAGIKSLGE